ncbi:aromatic amino acid DMT transporter YddG [Pseudomonas sp. UL073]|uniref:Aromatic amino acid DMT transporter YddG n=1 Tax=Zestomonas insulae TaxID=2809017 RepID=A0ABS2IAJ3_9GAMM|nr:aromatic amino acid DMT transporter YddG [Pseudomonas insulae]MBM7060131.1 aromatic amino acid DMT transporter YddG [Pseudomonas insulae]
MSSANRLATLYGVVAIVLWSTIVGLIRSVTEQLGAYGGAALIYTVGAALLLVLLGRPRLRSFSRGYLAAAGALFVVYEFCLSLSLGFAQSRAQAIEVAIVNYLWPCFTVLLAIAVNRQPVRWMIVPGVLLALAGIAWVVGGEAGLSVAGVQANVAANPLSYGLAFVGAVLWACYCAVTSRYSKGGNGVALFFSLTALAMWGAYGLSNEPALQLTLPVSLELLAAGSATAVGYALWNVGIVRGNLTLLATASNFTPVLSTLFAAVWLSTQLSLAFWQGVAMVCLGSLLCWLATRGAGRATG